MPEIVFSFQVAREGLSKVIYIQSRETQVLRKWLAHTVDLLLWWAHSVGSVLFYTLAAVQKVRIFHHLERRACVGYSYSEYGKDPPDGTEQTFLSTSLHSSPSHVSQVDM